MSSSRVARCSSLIRVFSLASHCPMLAVAACRFICCCAGAALPFEAWSLVTGVISVQQRRRHCPSPKPTRRVETAAGQQRREPCHHHLSGCPTRCLLCKPPHPGHPFATGWLGRPRGGLRYLQPVCLNNPHHHKGLWMAS